METTLTKEIKDTCLYMHTRKKDGRIFYIGIGNKKRPYKKDSRSKHWHNVVKKDGFEVTILLDGLTWEQACLHERNMIAFYGRKDLGLGPLVNETDGGEGSKGLIISEERKEMLSKEMSGEGNPMYRKSVYEVWVEKYGIEEADKLQKETNEKRRCNWSGENNPNFGKDMSGENNPMFGRTGELHHNFGVKNPKHSTRMSGENNPASTKVICIVTNKIYGCVKDAAKDVGVNYSTLLSWLRKPTTNKTSLRYL